MTTMTDLASRPVLRVERSERPLPRSIALSAAVASLWVAAAGLIACVALAVAVWFATDVGSFTDATRIGGLAWLVASGAGLQLDGYSVGVVPLGFTLAAGLGLHRGGRWVVERCEVTRPRDAALAVVVMSTTYAAVVEVTALLTASDAAGVGLVRAAVAGGVLAAVGGGSGVLRECGVTMLALDRLPEEPRAALVGGTAGTLTMVAAGGVLLCASLVWHFAAAVQLAEGLGAGYVGGLALAVIGMSLVPNAVLCAGAYLAGPGFAVGQGTLVAPGSVELGPLPAFPLLAALPHAADGWWTDLLVLVPVLAGGCAGAVALLRYPVFGLDRAALRGAVAGLSGGVGFGGLCWLATGAIGPSRMQEVGPDVFAVTVVCAAAGLVGGAVAGLGTRWMQSMRAGRRAA
jgi:hypothetical protein